MAKTRTGAGAIAQPIIKGSRASMALLAFAALFFAAAALLVAAPSQQAWAANDRTITIDNAQTGQTYTLYKLFDATVTSDRAAQTDENNSTDVMSAGINYTLPTGKSLQTEYGGHVGTTWFTVDDGGNVKQASDNIDITTLDFANWAEGFGDKIGESVKATSSTVEFKGLSDGYYYITSSMGSLVTVTSVAPNAVVKDKNQAPTLDKTEDVKTSYSGDTVTYTVGISIPTGQSKLVFHDQLADGLTLQGTAPTSVKVGDATTGDELAADNYTVNHWSSTKSDAGDNITITFSTSYLSSLESLQRVYLTYTAKFEGQHINAENEAYLTYGDNDTESDHRTVYESSFFFTVNKVDGSNAALSGAKFVLSKNGKLGNLTEANYTDHSSDLLKFTGSGLYSTTGDTVLFTANNSVHFSGLNNDEGNNTVTYYLYEVTAPDGYNKLTGPVEIQIVPTMENTTTDTHGTHVQSFVVNYKMPGDANYSQAVDANGNAATGIETAHNIKIANSQGAALPSTGGAGTVLMYVIGAVLVIAAGVALVARRKARKE